MKITFSQKLRKITFFTNTYFIRIPYQDYIFHHFHSIIFHIKIIFPSKLLFSRQNYFFHQNYLFDKNIIFAQCVIICDSL